MPSDLSFPDAGGAATFSGASVASSYAPPSSHPPGHSTNASTQHSIKAEVDAAVNHQLLLLALARQERIPDFKLKTFNGKQAQWINFNRSLNAPM